jgi:hypothetical protein
MVSHINREHVNDTAKLIMHRLIARELGRDPSLVERARASLAHKAARYAGYSFIQEWNDLLNRPVPEIRHRLTSRDEGMSQLRLSSPFMLAEGISFENEALRRRIWRTARRIAARSMDINPAALCG